jgi:CRP-like cAMP-binding protein
MALEESVIDVRGMPVWERPGRVFERFDALPLGGRLTFVTEYEPRGLAGRIEAQRPGQSRVEALRVADSEWRVTLTRLEHERSTPTVASALRRCSVFADLDDVARARLIAVSRERTLHKGEMLIEEGDDFPYLGIVWEGVLAISSMNAGRRRSFYEIFPFEIFGDVELFDHGLAMGRIVALSKVTRCLFLPREAVRQLGVSRPEILFAIATVCAQRTRSLAESLAAQGTQPIVHRLAAVLLPYSMPDRGLTPAMPPLSSMTQTQLASAAGTVKEVAARAIAELESHGALKRERGHIRYLDRSRLLEYARR